MMTPTRNRRLVTIFILFDLFVLGAFLLYKIPSPISAALHIQLRRTRAEFDSFDLGKSMPVQPLDSRVSTADGMVQVYVPAGKFLMGTDDKEAQKNRPRHNVNVSAFWIDQTEVSNTMYAKCVDAGVCKAPTMAGLNPYYGKAQYDQYPVVYVAWESAAQYCKWADRRLPTEAEWEKAARGTDGRLYPWGNEPPTLSLANFDNAIGGPLPVDRYPLGASPYGALNMAGNVREWVADWFHEFFYLAGLNDDPLGPPEGNVKSLRGGSYLDDGNEIRVFNRFFHPPGSPGINRGFRCASDAQ
jgi:formylglycine-generating enzyme required for sulfatase activity